MNNLSIKIKTVKVRIDKHCGSCEKPLLKGVEAIVAHKSDGFITKYAGSYHVECWKTHEAQNIINIGKNK